METSRQAIDSIIDQIIIESRLNNLPEQDKEFFRENMEQQINARIGMILIDSLSESGLKKYQDLISENPIPDSAQLNELIKQDVPDFENKVKDGLDIFMKEVIASANKS